MTAREMTEKARAGLSALRKAVNTELKRKAKLGQYAIVSRNGKPARVKASTLIKGAKPKKGVNA
jgi:hypothetical protein